MKKQHMVKFKVSKSTSRITQLQLLHKKHFPLILSHSAACTNALHFLSQKLPLAIRYALLMLAHFINKELSFSYQLYFTANLTHMYLYAKGTPSDL